MIMMKFFFFSSLAHLYLILSSSVMPQYSDIEQKQYNDFELMSAFHKYLTISTEEIYKSLRSYVRRYYDQSPIDCLNLLDRYRSNWVFKVVFWKALAGFDYFIDPTKITPVYNCKVLKYISRKIRWTLFNCNCSDESKFKTELETISLMIKLAERTATELKSLGNNNRLIRKFDDLVGIWKYLIRNISIDFDNKTIDYFSLFRTINEINFIFKTDSFSNGPSLRIYKRYALLWIYLRCIFVNDCTVIFDTHHHHGTLISYLIMKFWYKFGNYYDKEFNPDLLRFLFEEVYNSGSLRLNPIEDLLSEYSSELTIPKKTSSFFVMARSLTEDYKIKYTSEIWKVRALAELEAYLFRHYRKVKYEAVSNKRIEHNKF